MSTALQLIPGVSMIFGCTNVVGAALWAAELERSGEKANEPTRDEIIPDAGGHEENEVEQEL
jgi:hypothetical protein